LGPIVALLPLMFFGGPGEEVVRPMVAVMLGGLIVSTLVALFIVPALYLRFGRGPGYADVVASAQPGVIQP
jgi:Cu/Ag efflux pump CusA